jgi:Bacterial Ig-like domain (group 2)
MSSPSDSLFCRPVFPLLLIPCLPCLFFLTGCSAVMQPDPVIPTVSITANPVSTTPGSPHVITVVAANAIQVTVTGSDGSSYAMQPAGGTQTVTPASTVIYTATATATGGGKASATVTVTVTAFPSTTVTISANPNSFVAGGSSVLTVTAVNASQVTVTGSDNSSYAMASAGGTQTVSPTATTTYTAVAIGQGGNKVSATATVTVVPKMVTSIAVTPANAGIVLGATQQFIATATYNDSTTANITTSASWTAANPAVATVNAAGLATGVGAGSTGVTASLSGVSGAGTLKVKAVTAIAIAPTSVSTSIDGRVQLIATATYSDSTTADVTSEANWTIANSSVASVNPAGLVSGVAAGSTTVTASLSGVTGTDAVAVSISPGTGVNIPTWHADNNRSGLNPGEQSLSPSNVGPHTFGKVFSYLVDGYVYGEPLLMSNITIYGSSHNVLYAATENDSVYAFDADNYGSGTPLWQVSLLQSGETPMTTGTIQPFLGVTSTPVIDPTTNTIYVVSAQTSAANVSTFRLSALDITTGAEKPGSPVTIQASVAGTNSSAVNGIVSLTTSCVQRAALLLMNGAVYIGFGSCHSGWLLAYDAQTLTQAGVFNASPNLNGEGPFGSAGGVWMGGGGPAADSTGNIYISTGNGPWDGSMAWGDSVLKFNSTLRLLDYFTPFDYAFMNCDDSDLAAGGLLLIPGTSQALAGGKTGKLYMVSTANLGQEQVADAGATQTLWFESDVVSPYSTSCTDPGTMDTHVAQINSYENFGTAAYFNGSVYLGITPTASSGIAAGIRQFAYSTSSTTLTAGTIASQNVMQSSYGTTPFISANGTTNGIVWMIDHGIPIQEGTSTNATLRAYDVNNLASELYDSGMNSADMPGYGVKFTSPVVGNGKVYISTGHDLVSAENPQGEIDVYGLK